ncbi:uncharacterized protein A1O5_12296 [Cladophialophora psammophila CBS 110553]|uniref:Xylanolytic transcriptional activator regulatory domain-containing protein n=1 Tax=Cladophialophora psammophila CBS 110553 TaxID=1182543 RepID=W9W343_9EURO|nr:uncharacterized protein A1O5_12296 [Cladophialophora psammophila CBS 110553]EXJ59415.1 hypothetical protein A1O5_12296 [Cladophialophora psammophila CBS 110553]
MQMEKEVDGLGGTADGEEEVIPLQKVNWEHHGPWSWVSVCSRPGVRWVCERTKSDEFSEVASGLTRTWSRRLKMKRYRPLQIKYPDPALALAWKYVEGYFEQSYDAVFGIVHRPSFEARLHAHFENPTAAAQDDGPSWFALRNIIFAAGSRCVLAADPTVSFVQAEVQAAQYFQNALSVFSEIIFGHSGFTAVQALALMAFYSEGLGSPALEYPLCTNAVQLAQARGLHREPPKSWGLSASDDLNRRWLWWAIYCLEKQIAFRSGRPSLIDDNNISTTIPTSAPPGSTNDVEAFTLIVRHAQISSQISHRIMSVKAFKQAPAQVLDTVHDIHNKLQELLHSLPADLSVDPSESGDSRRPRPRWTQSLYLHFAIHGSLMATHIILFYPWIAARFGTESDPVFHNQVLSSSKTIANSARQIIRILRSVTTDIAAPAWLTFYYPMYAHINLFVYLLKFPSLSSVLGDLALLDMCTGHFGHIEHVTNSDISFHFPRESAALCLKFIKANQPQGRERETAPGTPQAGANPTLHSNRSRNDLEDIDSQLTSSASRDLTNGNLFDAMDIDVESWNIFSSIDITSDLTAAFGAFVPVEKETNESSTS